MQDRWPDPPKPPQAGSAGRPRRTAGCSEARPRPQPKPRRPSGEELLDTPAPKKPARGSRRRPRVDGRLQRSVRQGLHRTSSSRSNTTSRNITFGEVDGPEGSKIPGSILFPNDPKRRLEVIWAKEAGRSETSVIAINGKSQWSAPKGMKLGLPLAALEKANGRPFKLSGFDADGSAGVAGWEGGALGAIPGGCKIGMRLAADPKVPKEARAAVSGDKEILSNDAGVRALKPMVVEILIGY